MGDTMFISEIIKCVNGITNIKYKDFKIKNIVIDSRKVNKGDVFISLKGKNKNGNDYIEDALKRKAKCIITDEDINIDNILVIKVNNSYDSLLEIGKYYREKYSINVIGITGSIGKTTTKELISNILEIKYNVLKNEKSFNNHIGVPLTLFNLNEKNNFLIMELGMNHKNEISMLSKLISPDIGIITNISSSHIGNLGSIKNILKSKLEILDGMKNKRLIVNGKNKYLNKLKYKNINKVGSQELIPFSIKSELNKTSFKVRINNEVEEFNINGPYKHLISNFLIAIKVGLIYDINIEDIKKTINNFKPIDNRLEIIRESNVIINDSYNSSYESLMGIVDIIKDYKNKVFILGDILELGKYSKKIHKTINKDLKQIKDLEIITIGKDSKYIKGKHFNEKEDLINYIKNKKYKNKLILVKGSRRMELDSVIKYLY